MKTWRSGRESALLDDIIAGRKTIEARLRRDKFAEYAVGDHILLRRDYRDAEGQLHDGEPDAAEVEITAVRQYESFQDMVLAEGYQRVIPSAKSPEAAAAEYNRFYSADDQVRHGVLAIEIKLLAQQGQGDIH